MLFGLKFKSDFYDCSIKDDGSLEINLKNSWDFKLKRDILNQISAILLSKKFKRIILNFAEITELDYAAALFISSAVKKSDKKYELINLRNSHEKIFTSIKKELSMAVKKDTLAPAKKIINIKNTKNFLYEIGEKIGEFYFGAVLFFTFLGEFLVKFIKTIFIPKTLRIKEILAHFENAAIKSAFIVCLTSFLVGIVLAYQGANLLEQFGASIIIVEMMGMLTLREIAPLIAAIVIAGRLASSYTAQIGVMKITEEVDAMKTMGFDPFKFLVLPRVIALIFAMPIIVFLADLIGLLGEMVVCQTYLDISFGDYLARFKQEVEIRHFYVGLFKAPFFGMVIAFIGCWRGFAVGGNTQSVGKYTTISVVNSIFGVIMTDALFSIIFTQLEV